MQEVTILLAKSRLRSLLTRLGGWQIKQMDFKASSCSTLLEEELALDSHLCSWRDFLWILERNLSWVSPSTLLHKCPQPLLSLTMQSFTPTQLLNIVIVPFWLITRLSMILQGLNIS